jgi:hypothetical protein
MGNLTKIRGEFLSEREADSAVEKISPHCFNVKIFYNSNAAAPFDGLGAESHYDFPDPNLYSYNFADGMNLGWGLNPFSSFNFEHTRSYNHLTSLGLGRNSGKTVLEADVERGRYEFVKEKLYSLGALSVN